MPSQSVFPTLIFADRFKNSGLKKFNQKLKAEIIDLSELDRGGQIWSKKNYAGGYTSYASVCNLQHVSPTFAELETRLETYVKKYVNDLDLNLQNRRLVMTTCWASIMPKGTYHSMHIHPYSVISGTYYVDLPKNSSPLKIENPNLDRHMARPSENKSNQYLSLKAAPGAFYLFESWLRHEVPPQRAQGQRISISFNYEWMS